MTTISPSKGLKIKGSAVINLTGPKTPVKTSSNAKRPRKRSKTSGRNKPSSKKLTPAEFINLNRADVVSGTPKAGTGGGKDRKVEVEEEDDQELSFFGGNELASPEAGPSRLPMINTPSSFTPLRSILSGMDRHRSFSPEVSLPSTSKPCDSEPSVTIVVDDRSEPPPPPPGPNLSPPPLESTSGVSEHFEPPGLFSATLDESALPTTNAAPNPNPNSNPSGDPPQPPRTQDELDDGNKSTLLLPANVLLDDIDRIDGPDTANRGDDTMEGLHFVDDEISKGVQRYFDGSGGDSEEATFLANADQSKICTMCKRPGHRQWNCPHIICTVCGAEDEHERKDCPHGLICFGCGQRGHRQNDCPDPVSRNSRKRGCDRCGSRDHPESNCPSVWRVYAYWSADERNAVKKGKRKAEGWEKEATGGAEDEQWCYNCAQEGHLGDDCPRSRGSFAKLFFPSAFSYAMSSRGPFFVSRSSKSHAGTPTHARWDDEEELPFVLPGFQGSNAGQKSRDKARRAMIDREKGAMSDTDPEDWFAGTGGAQRGGMSIRGQGQGRGGRYTPNNPSNRGRGGRPWDSDSKRFDRSDRKSGAGGAGGGGLPFGHGHLMGSAPAAMKGKGISFGKLTLPANDLPSPSPTPAADKPKKKVMEGKGLLAKALEGSRRSNELASTPSDRGKIARNGNDELATPVSGKRGKSDRGNALSEDFVSFSATSTPATPASKKKKRKAAKDEEERDWETKWWSSGKGGGNVSEWGKEMVDSPSASGTKGKKKGNRGQQYVGGY